MWSHPESLAQLTTGNWYRGPRRPANGRRDGRDGRCLGYARGPRCRRCIGVRCGPATAWGGSSRRAPTIHNRTRGLGRYLVIVSKPTWRGGGGGDGHSSRGQGTANGEVPITGGRLRLHRLYLRHLRPPTGADLWSLWGGCLTCAMGRGRDHLSQRVISEEQGDYCARANGERHSAGRFRLMSAVASV